MSKKAIAVLGVVALGIGGISTIAFQSHAQAVVSAVTSTTVKDVSPPSDTDNIQNDQSGVDKPDAVIDNHSDGETNDDATTTVTQKKDTQEQGENTAADTSEVEDSN